MGASSGNAACPPIPLSQQMVAWCLQAMGLTEQLSRFSSGTLKNALRGKVLPRTWDEVPSQLIKEVLSEYPAEDLASTFEAFLRSHDRRVSKMTDWGLPVHERMPAILDAAIPWIGMRLGVLAAMIDGGAWREAKERVPELADWVTEPLSPRVMGRVLRLLARMYVQECDTLEACLHELPVDKRTYERWIGKAVRVPKPGSIEELVSAFQRRNAPHSALLLLRVGRLLTVLQRDLDKWLGAGGDEEGLPTAGDVARHLTEWAQQSRAVFCDPSELSGCAEAWAGIFDGPEGEDVLRGPLSWLFTGRPDADVEPGQVAENCRAAARRARETQDCEPLRFLQYRALIMGDLFLFTRVGRRMGRPEEEMLRIQLRKLDEVYESIEARWMTMALAKMVAGGALPSPEPGGDRGTVHPPSEGLWDDAKGLLRKLRRIGESVVIGAASQQEVKAFWCSMGVETGSHEIVGKFLSYGERVRELPDVLEVLLPDDVVQDFPHLAIARARRLMEDGKTKQAMEWYRVWRRSSDLKPWGERRIAAEVIGKACEDLFSLGNRLLDSRRRFLEERSEAAPLPEEIGRCDESLTRVVEVVDSWFKGVHRLLEAHPQSPENEERLVFLLPLAMQVDAFVSKVRGDGAIERVRSEPLARQAEALLTSGCHNGDLYAVVAAYTQKVSGRGEKELATRYKKLAVHYGGRRRFESTMESLNDLC